MCFFHLLGKISPCAFECVCVCVWYVYADCQAILNKTPRNQNPIQRKSNATNREFPELGIGAVLTNQNDVKKDVACFLKK